MTEVERGVERESALVGRSKGIHSVLLIFSRNTFLVVHGLQGAHGLENFVRVHFSQGFTRSIIH